MKSIENIRQMLSSDNIDVIRLCEYFINERAELERRRGDSAERRANIILSTLGASSAFLVFIASNILNGREGRGVILFMYIYSVLWVSRSVWYCVKSIRTQSRYRLTEESIFAIQDKSEIDAMKDLLSGKIWELQRSIQPNTERMFYAQRAQRAFVVFVGILLLLGGMVIARDFFSIHLHHCILFIISVIAIFFWLFGDYAIEKIGIWNY